MAPLVPDIIGNELNLIVALIIGIAFGYILEQAGFSESKKLVGLFYGYDFTVLRVFFTGGITAMTGVVILGHYGLLDLNLIYVNPVYIWSAISGGLIMGLGFVIGGFCPGTSICAASIGKIDAMIFVLGSFIGVYIFAEGYPLFEEHFKSGFWGNIRLFEIFGISQSLFAFLMVLMAVGAFILTTIIEKKNNGYLNKDSQPVKLYFGLAAMVLLIGISSFAFPERQNDLKNESLNPASLNSVSFDFMDSDELAYRLLDNDRKMQIFDFRSKGEYKELALPQSSNWTLDDIFGKDINKKLSLKNMDNVIIANDETEAARIAFIAAELGYKNIYVLKGGMIGFKEQILNFSMTGTEDRNLKPVYEFRADASKRLPELIEANKKSGGTEEKKTKRIIGGC
ncbi:MAG: YeeE/YedE family protein [Ignavibacteria bacterium]|nr:YeeE/YedE family protein [Ignavibacteria bacterium]